MSENYTNPAKAKMQDNIQAFRSSVRKIRTGRANPALLDGIQVLYYGSPTHLSQIANISSPSPRVLVVSP